MIQLYSHTTTLPIELHVKEGVLVEIYSGNYNTQDGIVNGSDDIFKLYSTIDDNDIVWIKFNDAKFGHKQRTKYIAYYNDEIEEDWIPILRITRPILKISTNKKITIRKQFLIQVACARTIH